MAVFNRRTLNVFFKTRNTLDTCLNFTLVFLFVIIVIIYCYQLQTSNINYRMLATRRLNSFTLRKYSSIENDLPLLNKSSIFPVNSIFFLETFAGTLTSRQACAIESAAKANSKYQISVLFVSPVTEITKKTIIFQTLMKLPNVKLNRVKIDEFAQGTPLEKHIGNFNFNERTEFILKYLTVYKYSGIFLSWDVITAKSLKNLGANWIVKQDVAKLSTDIFSFSEDTYGRKLASQVINLIVNELDHQGDLLLTDVLTSVMQDWCHTSNVMLMDQASCEDIEIHSPKNFFPISFFNREDYFRPAEVYWKRWRKDKTVYGYYTYESFTRNNVVDPSSLYGELAMQFCPEIYKNVGV